MCIESQQLPVNRHLSFYNHGESSRKATPLRPTLKQYSPSTKYYDNSGLKAGSNERPQPLSVKNAMNIFNMAEGKSPLEQAMSAKPPVYQNTMNSS